MDELLERLWRVVCCHPGRSHCPFCFLKWLSFLLLLGVVFEFICVNMYMGAHVHTHYVHVEVRH